MLSQLFYHPMMEAKVALLLPSRGGNSFHCQCKLPGLNNILAIICSIRALRVVYGGYAHYRDS